MSRALIAAPHRFAYYPATGHAPLYNKSNIEELKMRKLSVFGLISAAAALSFFCASMVMTEGPSGHSPVIVATSR
ncbi:hypothetical protein HEAR3466 [Herminiimonas arsenicoxydans]|uniref:Uncharacterized protein n=1 Tax=Herminiimonas arsenicoxydans TaxID=204773 RepID=A4GAN0_HERAR|nr:hypothetical protein HEAR3466 [Herminiimonas arsenicoxydans]